MGCRILVGNLDNGGGVECACFYDSTTDSVFGELFNDLEEAESFQKWSDKRKIKKDLRELSSKEFSLRLLNFRDDRERENEN